MARSEILNCSALAEVNNFADYVQQLRHDTGFNASLISICQLEICGALWGVGNPDVSGIGITAGYITEVALGFILAVLTFVLRQTTIFPWMRKPVQQGLTAFFNAAIYFAIAIQLASIVALVKKDFNINTDGFGAYEAQIAWAVSVVSILPLLYPLSMLQDDNDVPSTTEDETKANDAKPEQPFRAMLLCLTTALFFYVFVSQSIHNWAPTQVGDGHGDGGGTIITNEEYGVLDRVCVGETTAISDRENRTLATFELIASLLILLFTAWIGIRVLLLRNREWSEDSVAGRLVRNITTLATGLQDRLNLPPNVRLGIEILGLLIPTLLAGPLLWGIFRLRAVQEELASTTNNLYVDNYWGFGQIVSIVIFAPVVFDMIHCWFVEDD